MTDDDPVARLLTVGPRVVNIGLDGFACALRANAAPVVNVRWSPPANGDAVTIALLERLGV